MIIQSPNNLNMNFIFWKRLYIVGESSCVRLDRLNFKVIVSEIVMLNDKNYLHIYFNM